MSRSVQIYSLSSEIGQHSISLHTGIEVAQNEPMLDAVLNRGAKKLLENDLALYELYKEFFNKAGIKEWSRNATYNNGDFVWYQVEAQYGSKLDAVRLFLLKCIVDGNRSVPDIDIDSDNRPIDERLKNSGWEDKSRYMTIFDYGIKELLQSLVEDKFERHQEDTQYHPLGKLSLLPSDSEYIGEKLLVRDMHNIDANRKTVFFPQKVIRLDSGYAIMTGYMRNYGKILEYDIVLKLASSQTTDSTQIFSTSNSLLANTLVLHLFSGLTKSATDYQENDKYFQNSSMMDIFAPSLDSSLVHSSKIGLVKQFNRNDYVNTYSAQIQFDTPFADRKYMVFTNSILCQTNGTESNGHKTLVPSQNEIAVCNKTRDSITLLNISFPDLTSVGDDGHNASNGGIAANSFHCKVIGKIGV